MKVKQISTTNSKFAKYNNKVGNIKLDDYTKVCIIYNASNHRVTVSEPYSYSTSYIKEVKIEGKEITFYTRNSVYTYEILEENIEENEAFLHMNLSEGKIQELEDKIHTAMQALL